MPTPRYETSDLPLAAFVLSQGVPLAACIRASARRFVFQFPADEQLHRFLRLYWHRVPLEVIPAELYAALSDLKSLIRAQP